LDALTRQAEFEMPGDALYRDAVRTKFLAEYNQMKSLTTEQDAAAYDAVAKPIIENRLTSAEQFWTAEDGNKDLWNALDGKQQAQMLELFQKNSSALEVKETDPGVMPHFQQLEGQSVNDPKGFMAHDFAADKQLTPGQQTKFIEMAAKMRAGEDVVPPTLSKALSLLNPNIEMAGFGKDTESYERFVSKLGSSLARAQTIKGTKPLSEVEIRDIGKALLQDVVTDPGNWWFNPTVVPRFMLEGIGIPESVFSTVVEPPPVPEADRFRITQEYMDKTGKVPTDEQVQIIYGMPKGPRK
jgi:hypothetical protein